MKSRYVTSQLGQDPGGHTCHAKGCKELIPPALFMCPRHWKMVPADLQQRIWRLFKPGQELRKDPTPEYIEAANLAIVAVEERERSTVRCIRCLTVWPEWVWAFPRFGKDIENRGWPMPAACIGTDLGIHAGKSIGGDGRNIRPAIDLVLEAARRCGHKNLPSMATAIREISEMAGKVVLVAKIEAVMPRRSTTLRWHVAGQIGTLLTHQRILKEPVPARGAQGLWMLPPAESERVHAQLADLAARGSGAK